MKARVVTRTVSAACLWAADVIDTATGSVLYTTDAYPAGPEWEANAFAAACLWATRHGYEIVIPLPPIRVTSLADAIALVDAPACEDCGAGAGEPCAPGCPSWACDSP